jgi:two-component system, chemotaxis family, chemotaxis protein CheY
MGIKLVIVDDAPFIREALRTLLKNSEFECVGEAIDGVEAVKVIRNLKPEIVLLDLVLPKKNGIEVAREILEEMPKIKIIACSTEGRSGLMLKALDAGCAHFLTKPFTSETLLTVLRNTSKPPSSAKNKSRAKSKEG